MLFLMCSLHFMAILTVCATQENVGYKPIPEANTLNLRSVPTFHFGSLWNTVFVISIVLVLVKGIFFYQQYLDDLLLRYLFFPPTWNVVSIEDSIRVNPELRGDQVSCFCLRGRLEALLFIMLGVLNKFTA